MILRTMLAQDPAAHSDLVNQTQNLQWVDITALSVLTVFFIIGLWKGFVWQTSRIAILGVAYFVAGRLGPGLGDRLLHWLVEPPLTSQQQETALYIAYVLLFLVVLVLLSLLALLLQDLIKRAGLSFFDRLGGGFVGVATGGCVVLFLLSVVFMFAPQSHVAQAAETSHAMQLSARAVDWCGKVMPDEVRRVFNLKPLREPLKESLPTPQDGAVTQDAANGAGK